MNLQNSKHQPSAAETTRALAFRAVDKLAGVRSVVLLGWTFNVTGESVPRVTSSTIPPLAATFARRLSMEELKRYASEPSLDLDLDFLREVRDLGHQAYGVIEHDQLQAYEFFSGGATPVPNGVTATFGEGYRYVYKAFTRPGQRGRGLHGLITRTAAKDYQYKGDVGMVAYARATNHPSVRSFRRLGFRITGAALLPDRVDAGMFQRSFSTGPAWLRFVRAGRGG